MWGLTCLIPSVLCERGPWSWKAYKIMNQGESLVQNSDKDLKSFHFRDPSYSVFLFLGHHIPILAQYPHWISIIIQYSVDGDCFHFCTFRNVNCLLLRGARGKQVSQSSAIRWIKKMYTNLTKIYNIKTDYSILIHIVTLQYCTLLWYFIVQHCCVLYTISNSLVSKYCSKVLYRNIGWYWCVL